MKDPKALFKIGYGLYLVTVKDKERDTGLIVNTVCQITAEPERIAVTVSKQNHSHGLIKDGGRMNVCCISKSADMSLFERFGFRSGKDTDKFDGIEAEHSENGLAYIKKDINAVISLSVTDSIDFGTHTMFVCAVTESFTLSDDESVTYDHYQKYIKPKKKPAAKKGFVCRICGYVHESDTLPGDFICPICKHGAADFEPIGEEKAEEKQEPGEIFVCGACGYVHKGPMEEGFSCPVCGVDSSLFFKQ